MEAHGFVAKKVLVEAGAVPLQNPIDEKPNQDMAAHWDGAAEAPNLPNGWLYVFGKRCFDIFAALVGCVVSFLPMVVIAILIRIDSPGPVIFKQERLGKTGKPFVLYKFRSMKVDAEKEGPQWAAQADCRCTRVGRVLRMSRLDELPQLWNILAGEMSVVGPRPERACFYEIFENDIPGFGNRLLVKPGLTGLAQVNGGYDLPPERKIGYDMEYIQNWSFRLDLRCLLKTARLLITHEGAR